MKRYAQKWWFTPRVIHNSPPLFNCPPPRLNVKICRKWPAIPKRPVFSIQNKITLNRLLTGVLNYLAACYEMACLTSTTFCRDVCPEIILTQDTGTLKCFAIVLSTARLAFPSSAGALTETAICLLSSPFSTLSHFALGFVLTNIFITYDILTFLKM